MVWISPPPKCISDYISLRPNRILIALTKRQGGDGHGAFYLIRIQNQHRRFLHQFYLLFYGKLALRRRFQVQDHLADFSRFLVSRNTRMEFLSAMHVRCEQKFLSCTAVDSGRSWCAFQALLAGAEAQRLTYPWSILPPTARQENNRGIMRTGEAPPGNSA